MDNKKIGTILLLIFLCSCNHKHIGGITINRKDTSVVLNCGDSMSELDITEYDNENGFVANLSYSRHAYYKNYDSTKKVYLNRENKEFTKYELGKFSFQMNHYYVVEISSLGFIDTDTFRLYDNVPK